LVVIVPALMMSGWFISTLRVDEGAWVVGPILAFGAIATVAALIVRVLASLFSTKGY
jgi:hypothetical protein